MRKHTTASVTLLLLVLFGLVAAPSPGLAQSPAADLNQMSIEDLMRIEITSASRKSAPRSRCGGLRDHPGRHPPLGRDDDSRGAAPGAGRAGGADQRASGPVSVRGFNGLFSNKLLVLVDGRSVYNPLFSGVHLGRADLVLDDIDRIEVIRGPGAALWGANAMNGVINIITGTAAETQGGLVRVDGRGARRHKASSATAE